MKKLFFVGIIAVLAVGAASAQGWGQGQTTTVEGTLQLQNGSIVLVSGNQTYFVPMMGHYVGFVDGLQEGARVSVTGFANGPMLHPTQFTVAGRSYDTNNALGMMGGRGTMMRGSGNGSGRGNGGGWGWGNCH